MARARGNLLRLTPCGKITFVSISRPNPTMGHLGIMVDLVNKISACYSTLHSYREVQSIRVACVLLLDRRLAACVCEFVYC